MIAHKKSLHHFFNYRVAHTKPGYEYTTGLLLCIVAPIIGNIGHIGSLSNILQSLFLLRISQVILDPGKDLLPVVAKILCIPLEQHAQLHLIGGSVFCGFVNIST